MSIKSFRDLRVWQAATDFVEQVYHLTQTFPKHELYGLAGQTQRAAVSIASNIAEGHTRDHIKEYLPHLSIASFVGRVRDADGDRRASKVSVTRAAQRDS